MAKKWTQAQQAAIDIRNKTLLVSAAAGSGKTATLTERIIQRLTDKSSPADISKMLIVTFTRASAAELRSRIFSALGSALADDPTNKHLASQLVKLGSARISTIDSFYFDIVKANLTALGLPGSVRIADDAEYSMISHKIMESTIDSFYEHNEDFPAFVECFAGIRSSNALADIFLDIYQKLTSIPEGIGFIKSCAERTQAQEDLDFFASSYGSILKDNTESMIDHYFAVLKEALIQIEENPVINQKYGESFRYDIETCISLKNAMQSSDNGYSMARNIILGYAPISLKALSASLVTEDLIAFKEKRSAFTKAIRALSTKGFAKSPETIQRAMCDTSKYTYMLYELLNAFEQSVEEEKRRIGIMTFSDIRRNTLALLVDDNGKPTDIAKQYSEQFTEIYIDEYQDVDRVQDLIFRSISKGNNRFMVGDIKQSIYGFRGAEPQLFADYRREFPVYSSPEGERSEAVSLFMSNNFRCDENIIDFTNIVCSRIFSACADSIGYTSDDDLRFSKNIPEDSEKHPVQVKIIRKPSREERLEMSEDDPASGKELEAEYIASEIERLLSEEYKADGTPIVPGDIAVLYRSSAISSLVSEALKKRGISSGNNDADKYFENPDVLLIISLLSTIDNPEKDIHLAATLRSPLFDFSMDDLIDIRISGEPSSSLFGALCSYAENFKNDLAEKCRDFLSVLEVWQYNASAEPVDRFLRILFDDRRFVASGLISQVKTNGYGGNILLLYEYARNFESGSFKGLYQFLEYINAMIENNKTFPIAKGETSPDKVSLMTVHGSKGLEFPVCFFCDTSYSTRPKDASDNFVFNYDPAGVAMKVSESTGMARINTPMREAIISKIAQRHAEEEMRILYVALTRARERLYITASSSKDSEKLLNDAQIKARFLDKYSAIYVCSSYLDWILTACANKTHPSYNIEFINPDDINNTSNEIKEPADDTSIIDTQLVDRLKNSFSFEYPYKRLAKIPSKLSVSRLYPDVLDDNDTSLSLFSAQKKTSIPDFFLDGKKEVSDSAERGTATHLFMQFCDFTKARSNGAAAELSRLVQKGFFPDSIASLMYKDELEKFIDSDLIDRILSAKKVIREQRFNIDLPSGSFTKDNELSDMLDNEPLAVQGVIDLVLVMPNGEIELYDYKTDRLTDKELSSPALARHRMQQIHGDQLSYYAHAIELMFGHPCSRIAIYSTHSARCYDIERSDISLPDVSQQ